MGCSTAILTLARTLTLIQTLTLTLKTLCCLQFGLFHGDPHPGNIFALPDGRIAYCDFGNVAELSSGNKQTLIDAVVHAVNEDYFEMARDFIKLVSRCSDTLAALCCTFCLALSAVRVLWVNDAQNRWLQLD